MDYRPYDLTEYGAGCFMRNPYRIPPHYDRSPYDPYLDHYRYREPQPQCCHRNMRYRSQGKRCCNHHTHNHCHCYGSLFERFLRTPYIK